MFKILIISVVGLIINSCGVKNDVIPPEKPWVIFESPRDIDQTKKKKLNKGNKKNVNK